MSQRVQVGELKQAPRLKVDAPVVDTFISPAVDKPVKSNTTQLAEALVKFEPSLQEHVNASFQPEKKIEMNAGAIQRKLDDARRNLEGFKEGIDNGDIHAGQSPWFKKGYNHEKGLYLSNKFKDYVKTEYTKAPEDIRNAEDPAVFQAWMAQKRTAFNASNRIGDNADVLAGFNEQASQIESNVFAHNLKVKTEKIVSDRLNLMSANTQSDVKNFTRTRNKEAVLSSLRRRLQHFHIEGGNSNEGNKRVVDAILQEGLDSGNAKVIKLLEELDPSGLGALSTQPAVAARMKAVKKQIHAEKVQKENLDYTRGLRAKKQIADESASDVYELIKNDPMAEIPEDIMFKITRIDPNFPKTVEALRKMQHSEDTREDPDKTMPLFVCVASGNCDIGDINKHVGSTIRNQRTLDTLLRNATRVRQSGQKGYNTGFLNSDIQVKDIEKRLYKGVGLDQKGRNTGRGEIAAGKAVMYYKMGMYEYLHDMKHEPPLNSEDIRAYADKLADSLTATYAAKTSDNLDKDKRGSNVNQSNYQAEEHLADLRGELPDFNKIPLFSNKDQLKTEFDLLQRGEPNMLVDILRERGITKPADVQQFLQAQSQLLRN